MNKIMVILSCIMLTVNTSACGKNNSKKEELLSNQDIIVCATENPKNSETDITTDETKTLQGIVICVDAGHGINSFNTEEAIAPNTSETKNAFTSGTRGKNQTEEQLNLIVAKKLEAKLLKLGAEVHMTRTEHNCDMTNIDRSVFANNINADISVKIHADGNNSGSVNGVSVLVPGNKYITDNTLLEESRKAAELILDEFVKATGAVNRGISVRNDLTGFNWSKVPIVLIEMGFMTNPKEDQLMETEDYQNKIVEGIVKGLELYFAEI